MCAWALRGTVPALAGNVGTGGAFALPREGNYRESTFLRSLWPGPAPLDVFGGGSAGSVLRSQGTLGQVELSRCRARGIRMWTFLCSLRTKPALPVSRGVAGSVPHMTHMRDRPLRPTKLPTQRSTLPSRHRVNLAASRGRD